MLLHMQHDMLKLLSQGLANPFANFIGDASKHVNEMCPWYLQTLRITFFMNLYTLSCKFG